MAKIEKKIQEEKNESKNIKSITTENDIKEIKLENKMSKKTFLFIAVGAVFLLVGCAGVNTVTDIPNPGGDIAGFWWGLWNGLTCWFAFFGSLFSDNISIYEVHNNGGWYDFGFALGAGILFGAERIRRKE